MYQGKQDTQNSLSFPADHQITKTMIGLPSLLQVLVMVSIFSGHDLWSLILIIFTSTACSAFYILLETKLTSFKLLIQSTSPTPSSGCNGIGKPRVRARRGQATDPHSIAERVS